MHQVNNITRPSSEKSTYGHEVSAERGIEARKLREANGLTRPVLGDMINRSERSIFRWETQGITEENYRLIEEAVKMYKAARAQSASGFSQLSMEALRNASTLDLPLELVSRAREIEKRNRSLDQMKDTLELKGLGHLIPEDY